MTRKDDRVKEWLETNDITTNSITATNINASGTVQGAHLKDTSLTAGRVPIAGTGGQLEDDADLTFSGTTLSATNLTSSGTIQGGIVQTAKARLTPDGGFAVLLTNKTGGASVKGEVVHSNSGQNNSVIKIVVDVPDPIGVFYESGIADGQEAWVVVSGIADVYFVGNATRGQLARGFLTADGASYVTGQALAENVPSSPFADDKHFYEIGHVLESRTGAGLAKCVLHFN